MEEKRTCCCCCSIDFGVAIIGMITFAGAILALFNIRAEWGWLEMIFRIVMLPFFFICCT